MMAHKLASVSLVLVCAVLTQPALAQRGGGGGGGGNCGGGGTQSASNSDSALSPHSLNPMANQYALQQMQHNTLNGLSDTDTEPNGHPHHFGRGGTESNSTTMLSSMLRQSGFAAQFTSAIRSMARRFRG